MKLYNTLTRTKEDFYTNEPGKVKMYTCGPTVYHYAHIGNLRTYIMEDALVRTLDYLGYKVKRVMNITDVGHLTGDSDEGEDKMLKGAKREHKTVNGDRKVLHRRVLCRLRSPEHEAPRCHPAGYRVHSGVHKDD